MAAKVERDAVTGVDTTGHEWDGIRELDNPMPTLVGLHLLRHRSHRGRAVVGALSVLAAGHRLSRRPAAVTTSASISSSGWRGQGRPGPMDSTGSPRSTRPRSRPIRSCGSSRSPAARSRSRPIAPPATASAARARASSPPWPTTTGSGAATLEQIEYTIRHGIRNGQDPDARDNAMPAFGADGLLDQEQIARRDPVCAVSDAAPDRRRGRGGRGARRFSPRTAPPATARTAAGMQEMGAPRSTTRSGCTAASRRRSRRRSTGRGWA